MVSHGHIGDIACAHPDFWPCRRSCTMFLHSVNILSRLYHAPLKEGEDATGTATIGSSEACMLVRLSQAHVARYS